MIPSVKPASFSTGLLSLVALALLLTALPVAAHPGHGPLEHGLAHQLVSPAHSLGLLMVGLLALGAARFVPRPVAQRVLRWSGSACAVGGVVCWGLGSMAW